MLPCVRKTIKTDYITGDRGNVLKKNTRVQARYYGEKGWNHGPEKSFYKGKITKVYGNPDNPEVRTRRASAFVTLLSYCHCFLLSYFYGDS